MEEAVTVLDTIFLVIDDFLYWFLVLFVISCKFAKDKALGGTRNSASILYTPVEALRGPIYDDLHAINFEKGLPKQICLSWGNVIGKN